MATKKKIARFAVGDTVKIRNAEEIRQTLDGDSMLEGCLMTVQMFGYCGKSRKILRVVRNIFDEYKYRMYVAVPTMYILEDLICDGRVHEFDHICNHSCYLMWHEEWLKETF